MFICFLYLDISFCYTQDETSLTCYVTVRNCFTIDSSFMKFFIKVVIIHGCNDGTLNILVIKSSPQIVSSNNPPTWSNRNHNFSNTILEI